MPDNREHLRGAHFLIHPTDALQLLGLFIQSREAWLATAKKQIARYAAELRAQGPVQAHDRPGLTNAGVRYWCFFCHRPGALVEGVSAPSDWSAEECPTCGFHTLGPRVPTGG